ncbi:MAG: chemotaxis protein CheA, partial [Bryobacteraceae bacterium]
MTDDLSQDASLVQDYLTECEELMQQLDQDLVTLESSPTDADLLNRVFRAFHTIKGTSGFMGYSHVVELTHAAEDVLNLLRKGERKVTRHTMDVLLAALDQLRLMVADIRAGVKKEYAVEPLVASLHALLQGPEAARDAPKLGEILLGQQVIDRAELHAALSEAEASGKKLGEVVVSTGMAASSQVKEALKQQKTPANAVHEAARTIRVDVSKLDELINLVGELVLERNRLVHLSRALGEERLSAEKFEAALTQNAARLSFLTDELQQAGLRTRMVTVDTVFRRIPRLVRDLSSNLGKEIELVINGEDTELDKTVVEQIGDPLVHLIRNSLDHGIETPAVREAKGKPRKGTVRL